MHLTNKIIELAITQFVGKEAVPLVMALKNKKDVSEFILADNIRKDINLTRNMLYKLFDHNLVSSIRRKDKKKGWYVQYWTFNQNGLRYLIQKSKQDYLAQLTDILNKEKNGSYFSCVDECKRLEFEESAELQFKCPECGRLMEQMDNTQIVKRIENQLKEIKIELKN